MFMLKVTENIYLHETFNIEIVKTHKISRYGLRWKHIFLSHYSSEHLPYDIKFTFK